MHKLKYIVFLVYCVLGRNAQAQIDTLPPHKYPQIYVKFNPMGIIVPIHYLTASAEIRFTKKHALETEFGIINPYTGFPYFMRFKNQNENGDYYKRWGFRLVNSYKIYFREDKRKNMEKDRTPYFAIDALTNMHQIKSEEYYCRDGCNYQQLYPTTTRILHFAFGFRWGMQRFIGAKKRAIVDTYGGLGYQAYYIKEKSKAPADAVATSSSGLHNIRNFFWWGSRNDRIHLFNIIVGVKFGFLARIKIGRAHV